MRFFRILPIEQLMDANLKKLNEQIIQLIERGLQDNDIDGKQYAQSAGWPEELGHRLTIEPIRIPGPQLFEVAKALGIYEQLERIIAGIEKK